MRGKASGGLPLEGDTSAHFVWRPVGMQAGHPHEQSIQNRRLPHPQGVEVPDPPVPEVDPAYDLQLCGTYRWVGLEESIFSILCVAMAANLAAQYSHATRKV